jgi:hypothetical protein
MDHSEVWVKVNIFSPYIVSNIMHRIITLTSNYISETTNFAAYPGIPPAWPGKNHYQVQPAKRGLIIPISLTGMELLGVGFE